MVNKTNKLAIMKLCKEINKKEGNGSITTIDGKFINSEIPRWSTAIEDLDEMLGGGMPMGRIIEIYGPESSGKTTLLYYLCSLHPLCLDIPIEGSMDYKRAKVFGNKKGQMLVYKDPKYGEQALNRAFSFAKAGIPLIGIDSIPALIPKDDFDKVEKSASRNSIEEQRIGGTARLMTKYLPALSETIELTGTTVILINQVRDNLQATLFGPKTKTPGGRAVRHYSSIIIEVARKDWVDIPNKNPKNSAATEKIGIIMKCKCIKNKTAPPYKECELCYIYDRGFISFDDLPAVRKELMKKAAEKYGKKLSRKELEDDND